jgi:hypothetical protein
MIKIFTGFISMKLIYQQDEHFKVDEILVGILFGKEWGFLALLILFLVISFNEIMLEIQYRIEQ